MRKYISFLITLCISLAMLKLPAVASQNEDYSCSWQLAQALGIIDWDDTEKVSEVTRGEFAQFLANALELTDTESFNAVKSTFGNTTVNTSFSDTEPSSEKQMFSDVDTSHENYEAISAVCAYGIMRGNGGNFNPDRPLKYEEALKTFVVLCGYDSEALLNGGWFVGYSIVAEKIDLGISKKKIGTVMTKSELCHLFAVALETDIAKISGSKGDSIYYTTVSGYTFGEAYLDILVAKGQVTKNFTSALTSPMNYFNNIIVVDGIEMSADIETNISQYLGRAVKAYYRFDGTTRELIYMSFIDKDEVTVIDARDIEGYDDGILTYTEGNRTKKLDIKHFPVIYNGSALPSFDDTLFDLEYGEVIVTDGRWTKVVIVREFKDIIVSSKAEGSDCIIYSELTNAQVRLDGSDLVYCYKPDGTKASLKDIPIGAVISYVAGSNYKELYIGSNKAEDSIKTITKKTGSLSAFNTGYKTIVVDGIEYSISQAASEQNLSGMVGNTVTAYLNYFGEAFYVALSGPFEALSGYLCKLVDSDDMDTDIAKIFNGAGEFVTYRLAPKITLLKQDGTKTTLSGGKVREAITTDGDTYCGFVSYGLNFAGEISRLEIPLESYTLKIEGDGRLVEREIDVETYNTYEKSQYSFGGQVYLDDSVKLFAVPTDKSDYDDYMIVNYLSINNHQRNLKINAYFADFDDPIPEAVVLNGWNYKNAKQTNGQMYVVKKVEKGINEFDELVSHATLVAGDGTETTLIACEEDDGLTLFDKVPNFQGTEINALDEGDVVVYNTLYNSTEVSAMWMVFDADKDNGIGGKLGYLSDVPTGSDLYYLDKSKFDISDYNEYIHQDVTDQIVSMSNLAPFTNQNPFRVDLTEETDIIKGNTYRYFVIGYEYFLGYVADKNDAFIKLTTQDLSRKAEYRENGVPEPEDLLNVRSGMEGEIDNLTPIYHQRWFKYVAQNSYILTIEFYDRGTVIRKGTPADIYSYKEAGHDASRVLANNNNHRYFIINDYRSR